MKKLLLALLILISFTSYSQTTGYLRYDTVKVMKQNGNSNLIIENATRDTLGFLYNYGGGRTRFDRIRAVPGGIKVGDDTILINSGGFFSPDQTSLGPTVHDGGRFPFLLNMVESFYVRAPDAIDAGSGAIRIDSITAIMQAVRNVNARAGFQAFKDGDEKWMTKIDASDSVQIQYPDRIVSIADSANWYMMVQRKNASGTLGKAFWPVGTGGGSDTANLVIQNPPGFAGDSIWQASGDTLYLSTLIAGSNVTITRQVNGDLEISSTGGGGSTDTTSLSNRINAAYATMAAVNDSTFRLIRPNGTSDTIQINSVGSGGSGGGGGGQIYREILTSGTTWTTPDDITTSTRFEITMGGGGGGGGGHNTSNGEGSGGGAGGSLSVIITGLSPSTGYTYAIGAAGPGGAATPANGTAGGATTLTIGATTYTANGGGAGATAQASAGGVGGTAVNGDINITGQDGSGTGGTASTATPGVPGGSPGFGLGVGGGALRNTASSPSNATGYSAGGGGGVHTSLAGGNGTQGVIIIKYWK